MGNGTWRVHAWAALAYAAVAVAFTWPLALDLGTQLTGGTGGDTGVYVWNQWVFRHELVTERSWPYDTTVLFGAERPANLSLHNYTRFQNLIAVPLAAVFGVVTTFNLVYLLMTVLTAYAVFLLARHVTGRVGEAWLAGLLFAWSPLLVTRGMGHFSLAAAAPLAFFLLALLRADGHERPRDAALVGVTMAWAASTDVYYAIYCLLLGAIFLVGRVVSIETSPRAGRAQAARWGLDVLIACVGALVLTMAFSGGWELRLLGQSLRMHSLYTPVLVLTVLVALRAVWTWRPALTPVTRDGLWHFTRLSVAAGLTAVAVMSPVLIAAAQRLTRGEFVTPEIFWRSSPPGADLLAFVLPNPNHPFAPDAFAQWVARLPNGYLENVVSLPLVGLALLALAWRQGWRPSRWWAGVALLFSALAVGPFIVVAGVNTYVPGPWALLRYVPLVGLARSPSRFAIVALLALAVLVALALTWLGRRHPQRRRALLVGVGVLLACELLPAPRTLHSATIPSIYRHVAAAPRETKLLELPFGIRDGTSSVGNFTARTQFYQTAHGKTIMGGYLSRLSTRRTAELKADPVRHALALLSEGQPLPPEVDQALSARGREFVRAHRIGYVVIDRERGSPQLRERAKAALGLRFVEADGLLELYATAATPPH